MSGGLFEWLTVGRTWPCSLAVRCAVTKLRLVPHHYDKRYGGGGQHNLRGDEAIAAEEVVVVVIDFYTVPNVVKWCQLWPNIVKYSSAQSFQHSKKHSNIQTSKVKHSNTQTLKRASVQGSGRTRVQKCVPLAHLAQSRRHLLDADIKK